MNVSMLVALLSATLVAAAASPLAGGSRRIPPSPDRRARSRMSFGLSSGRRRERSLDDAYPDALDLLVVSVQAGRMPFDALVAIGPHVHPVIAAAISDMDGRIGHGQRSTDALDALTDALGSRALALVATLTLAERTGLAVAPMIDRIGDDARLHRRRRAEASARELPVRLSLPLVLCTLPSFVLVAIAPLLIGALSSLRGA